MSKIDVVKKNINFEQLIKQSDNSASLKNEYLIPDTHPDVEKILLINAKPIITSKEILSDKVLVSGKIEYNVIYIPREDNMKVNSVEYSEEFTGYLEVNNSSGKIACDAECVIEHIDFRVMNERKIEIECFTKMYYNVFLYNNFEFVHDLSGDKSLQVLKKHESINSLLCDKETNMPGKITLRVPMDKPEIDQILKTSLVLHKKEIKIGENKVYLGCYLKIDIIYMSLENGEIYSIGDDMYISKEEEIDGVFSEMIPAVIYEIENKDIKLEEDDLGESRIINFEVLVKAMIKVFFNEEIEALEDAYSTKYPINLNKSEYNIGVLKGIQSIETSIRDTINLKEDQKRPENIVIINGNPEIKESNIAVNKLTVEGEINIIILYRSTEDDSYCTAKGTIPFSSSMDINGIDSGMKSIVMCSIESIEGTIESNNIAIKLSLSLNAKVYSEEDKVFITDIVESDEKLDDKKSSIAIYVVDKNDTLWSLAKRFNSTVEAITSINDFDNEDQIYPGQKILIPGRAAF